ncbi:CAP domain-containing protein [Nonomuraea sp. NPDC052116]|uniref:CAP domain-containing protein n=1 Tax=Nonomuraea sp. NPDC052116 TaxID=3155665 RepID=UPI0034453F03
MRAFLAAALLATGLAATAAPAHAQRADCDFADNPVRTEPWFKKHKPELTEGQRKAAIVLMEGFASNAIRCLVNAERARVGVAPLEDSYRLYKAADEHVQAARLLKWWIDRPEDPKNKQWHINPVTHSDVGVRVRAAGYCPAGTWQVKENVFSGWDGTATPRAAVRWWMNSDEHRAAILDPAMKQTGISVRYGKARPRLFTDVAMLTTEVFGSCR